MMSRRYSDEIGFAMPPLVSLSTRHKKERERTTKEEKQERKRKENKTYRAEST
jgi:hypothetical protein